MPVLYSIDHEHSLIRTTCTANTTFAEVLGHFRELEELPSLPRPLDVFLDLTQIRSLPSLEELQTVAVAAGSVGSDIQWGAMAIVASSDVIFGVSRMFEAFTDRYFERVKVFRDAVEAERWLAAG